MKTKINSTVLNSFVGEENEKKISQFQKHLIQEGVKSFLLEDKCSDVMLEYLKDLRVIEGDTFFETLKEKSRENQSFLKSVLTNKLKTMEWNRLGYINNDSFFGTARDWNQTLITRINEVSSAIHRETCSGGGNLIIISPETMPVIEDLEYMKSAYEEFVGYCKLGTLGSRYLVISSTEMVEPDEIIVTRAELVDKKIKNSKLENYYGVIKILNHNKLFDID